MSVEQQIIDFVSGFTIETTPGSAAKTPDYRDHLKEGTMVAVTFLPGSNFADTAEERGHDPHAPFCRPLYPQP